MKAKHAVLVVAATVLALILQSGCGESRKKDPPAVGLQASIPTQQSKTIKQGPASIQGQKGGPRIEVANPVFDFGVVGPNKPIPCEFTFKNVGTETLVISKILPECRCTLGKLDKLDYAPGESGTIKATYRSSTVPAPVQKHLHILSNDKTNPRFELTIKGRVELKVAIEPKDRRLSLFLNLENAGAAPVTLTSKDKKPFAVRSFTSTGNAITVDLDPTVEKTVHVLKLKVDIEKLKKNLIGTIRIGLSHPETNQISLSYVSLPLYKVSPPRLIVQYAEPGKVVKRDVWVKSNYQQKVEIDSITSMKGYMEVVDRKQQGNSVKLAVQITPPPQASKAMRSKAMRMRYMGDKLTIKMTDGQELFVTCSGWYK
ncbi:MAG: DUF1573 domain-containing protein [Dehalococcoidales bacterium]